MSITHPTRVERVRVDLSTTEGRAEWLKLRQQDVTASVVAALITDHPFMTPHQLYRLKSGLDAGRDPEETKPMRRGRLLEPVAVEMLREDRPKWNIVRGEHYFRDPEVRLGATPDVLALSDEGKGIVQIKSVDPLTFKAKWVQEDGVIEPPAWIAIQAIVEAHLVQADWACVAPLVVGFGIEMPIIPIPIHPGIIEKVRVKVADFWERIQNGPDYDADPVRDYDTIHAFALANGAGPRIDLSRDNALPALLDEDDTLKSVEKETKDRRKAIKGELMMKLGEAGSADIADGRIITKSIIRRGEYTVKPTEYVQLRHKLPRR